MFLSIWNYLNNLEMAKLFPAAFRDNANLARGSKNLFLLMLKYTLFTPRSNYSFGQKIPFAFFFFLKRERAHQIVHHRFILFSTLRWGKHIWGWCWSVNVWFQIRPQEMSEGCFWVRADEDQYAKPDLLNRVALTFCTQRTGESPYYIYSLCCI